MILITRPCNKVDFILDHVLHENRVLHFDHRGKHQIDDGRKYQAVESHDLSEEPVLEIWRRIFALFLRLEVLGLRVENAPLVEKDRKPVQSMRDDDVLCFLHSILD